MFRRFGITVLLPGIVLLLFGLRTVEQDQLTLDRQIADRLQNTAQLASAAINQQLAQWQQFRVDGVIVRPNERLQPAERSAYELADDAVPEQPVPNLSEAERSEFRGDLAKAIALYQSAVRQFPQARREALLGLARTFAKSGKLDLVARTYTDLLRSFGNAPQGQIYEVIARFELCRMGRGDWGTFYADLVSGRWRLDKARYLFYSEAAREHIPSANPTRIVEREKLAYSAAIESFLQSRRRLLGGYVAFWDENESLILPASRLKARLERSVALDHELRIQLADERATHPPLSVSHMLGDRELQWVVVAAPVDVQRLYGAAHQRRIIYVTMLLLTFAVLAAGSYRTARAMHRELEVARVKNDFVATVSHEFRSPLTAIRQLSELLQRGRVSSEEKRQEYYGLILRESSRLSRLVENLLDFSRLEDGRAQYRFESLDASQWLRDVAANFSRGNMSVFIPARLPAIRGDRVALTSAVENLLDNAVKYSPPGSPVALEAGAEHAELTIRVRDQGFGIAEVDRSHVFEKFYRARGEISQKVKGAGVGLSLVRQIVEAHGGRVDFESNLGRGSEFRIHLKTV